MRGSVVDAGTPANDGNRFGVGQGRDQSGCGGGVSDSHITRDQQVGAGIDFLVGNPEAGLDRGGHLLGAQRVFGGDVAAAAPHLVGADRRRKRLGGIHGDVDNPHARPRRLGEHVDSRAARVEVGDHLCRYLRRVRRNARGGDAVVAGEHHHAGALKLPRRAQPLA